jgi:hypothetical protein
MFFLLRTAAWLAALGAVAYVAVFVPLGSHTLWEHITRIAGTEEAQELGREVDSASERLETALESELRERLLQPSPGAESEPVDEQPAAPPSETPATEAQP